MPKSLTSAWPQEKTLYICGGHLLSCIITYIHETAFKNFGGNWWEFKKEHCRRRDALALLLSGFDFAGVCLKYGLEVFRVSEVAA